MKNLLNHNIYHWPRNDNGATALDNIDAVIPAVVGGDVVEINTPGAQGATYNVSDAAGNPAAQFTPTVNVTAEVMIPVITLSGIDPVHAEQDMPHDLVSNPGAKILPTANCVNSNPRPFRKRFFSYISAPGFGLYVCLYVLIKWSVILIKP